MEPVDREQATILPPSEHRNLAGRYIKLTVEGRGGEQLYYQGPCVSTSPAFISIEDRKRGYMVFAWRNILRVEEVI